MFKNCIDIVGYAVILSILMMFIHFRSQVILQLSFIQCETNCFVSSEWLIAGQIVAAEDADLQSVDRSTGPVGVLAVRVMAVDVFVVGNRPGIASTIGQARDFDRVWLFEILLQHLYKPRGVYDSLHQELMANTACGLSTLI